MDVLFGVVVGALTVCLAVVVGLVVWIRIVRDQVPSASQYSLAFGLAALACFFILQLRFIDLWRGGALRDDLAIATFAACLAVLIFSFLAGACWAAREIEKGRPHPQAGSVPPRS
jgi:hypothetical protein